MSSGHAAPRLFVRAELSAGAMVELDRGQVHYLVNVLRLRNEDPVLVFNGTDGEWKTQLSSDEEERDHRLIVERQTHPQPEHPGLRYLFAPLKQGRLDYMVQKAVELGAGRLSPVLTQHTQVHKVNRDRMGANAVEAAEQCGILTIPDIDEPIALGDLIAAWDPTRRIVFCDEGERGANPVAILSALPRAPVAVLVGPEGGFSEAERAMLLEKPFVTAIPLGPRILRADTAAVAALTLVQAVLGDWRNR